MDSRFRLLGNVLSLLQCVLLLGNNVHAQLSNEVDFSDGFDCRSTGIQLNGNRPFPRMVNNGVNELCFIQLTSDKDEPRAVSAFTPVEFDDELFWFESRFRYRMFGNNAGSADGIAFVVHQDVRSQMALVDETGGKLGVYGDGIIKPALVVELDTFKNELGLIPSDEEFNAVHVTFIDSNGDVFEIIEEEFESLRTSPNGATDREVIVRHAEGRLTVSIDSTPVVDVCMKLTDGNARGPSFTGTFMTAGFTASTGTEGDQQEILLWQFQELIPFVPAGQSYPICNQQTKETIAPTTPPVDAPTNSPVVVPTPAPTPAPPRQARVQVTVAGEEELSETFIIAFEESCGLFLSSQEDLPAGTTCEVEQQVVRSDSTVVLTVLVEAIAPGLDIQNFADIVIAALNDPIFADPLNVLEAGLKAPPLRAVVTLIIDNVANGRLTPAGIAVLEASCREFLTIRVGNPNIRCSITQINIDDDEGGRRSLEDTGGGRSEATIQNIVDADAPSEVGQPETLPEFDEAVNGEYAENSADFLDDVIDRADDNGVEDFTDTGSIEQTDSDPFIRFLAFLIPIIRLLILSFAS